MESVGKKLREARTCQGKTLEQVYRETRISLRHLQAIEDDDCSPFSSPFFYRSFVRQYANSVGVDVDDLELDLRTIAASMPRPLIPGEGTIQPPKVKPLVSRRNTRLLRWLYYVACFAVVLTACSGFYAVWNRSDGSVTRKLNKSADAVGSQQTSRAQPSPPSQKSGPAGLAANATRSEDNQPRYPNASENGLSQMENGFRIELSALERTWVSIVADGKLAFTGILQPNEIKVLAERNTARVRTGNAGGLSCVFNGRSIGTLGPRGQVRTVVFKKSSYEVLEPPFRFAAVQFFGFSGE
jgi:cytoskeleton protein RodZ